LIKQITIFLENEPGSLFNATSVLSKVDVDIRAISMVETSNLVLLRIVVNEHEKAVNMLEESGVSYRTHDVLGVEVSDKPGGLADLAKVFAKNKINIEYIYPFVTKGASNAYLVVNTDNQSKAEKLLEKSSINLLDEEDFYSI